jgi:hypothetical protein
MLPRSEHEWGDEGWGTSQAEDMMCGRKGSLLTGGLALIGMCDTKGWSDCVATLHIFMNTIIGALKG